MSTANVGTAVCLYTCGNPNYPGQVASPNSGVTLPATLSSTGQSVNISYFNATSGVWEASPQQALIFDTQADAAAYTTLHPYQAVAYPA